MTQTVKAGRTKEFLSVKKFMELCGVNRYSLHYWDEIGLLIPAGRNAPRGHRYYSSDQIAAVHLIQALSSLGIPLNSMKDLGKNRDQMHTLFCDCEERLGVKISELQDRQEQMRGYAAQFEIEDSRADPPCEIEVRGLPEQAMHCAQLKGRYSGPAMQSGKKDGPAGYAFNEIYDLLEAPDRPARLVTFDPQGPKLRPAGEYLVGTVQCAFGEMNGLARRMLEYAMNNGLEMQGPAYVFYRHDAECGSYALQVTVGVNTLKTETEG